MGIRKYCSICEGEFIGHSIRIYFWGKEDNKLKLAHKGCYENRNNPDLYFYIRRTRPTKWD